MAITLLTFSTLNSQLSTLHAQGTAFMYQGRLNNGGSPATGLYDFQFALSNAPSGGSQIGATITNLGVGVTNGLFTTTLDFSNVFNGQAVWLAISVRTNGAVSYAGLTPLQLLTPTPYAIFAETASNVLGVIPSGSLSGTYVFPVTMNNPGNVFGGNGFGLTSLNASAFIAGTVPTSTLSNAWKIAGNTGANPTNGAYLGTADNLPLEFHVNGQRALRLEYATDVFGQTVNVIGGYSSNYVASGVTGATIGGGGDASDGPNVVSGNYSTVLGGAGNTASGSYSTVMGSHCSASGNGNYAFAEGGTANASAPFSTAMGNFVTASGRSSFAVGGGNTASGGWSTAMGGGTTASGDYSMAVGFNANATNNGAFVWGDTQNAPFSSTNNDSFNVRAQGGVRFVTSGAGMNVDGTVTATNFIGNGGGLTGLNPANLSAGTAGISITGNAATASTAASANSVAATNISGIIAPANLPGGLGGSGNTASGNYATVAGGQQNTANSTSSTVAGGYQNMATNLYATVCGGPNNTAGGYAAVVVGGDNNIATGTAAMVSGDHSTASGLDSFAAGHLAQATNDGAFVWADSSGPTFGSTNNNSFNVQAHGGARFVTFGKGMTVDGTVYANGVALTSDRNAKENFTAINAREVLAKLAALPVTEWNYKTERQDVRHLGPMAQDFQAAFGLDGADDKHISVIDEGGVALAAIQGLNEKVESGKQKAATQIQELQAENAELKARLEKLEKIVTAKIGGAK